MYSIRNKNREYPGTKERIGCKRWQLPQSSSKWLWYERKHFTVNLTDPEQRYLGVRRQSVSRWCVQGEIRSKHQRYCSSKLAVIVVKSMTNQVWWQHRRVVVWLLAGPLFQCCMREKAVQKTVLRCDILTVACSSATWKTR